MNTYAYHVRHKNGWGTGFGPRPTHCHACGNALALPKEGDCTTGYGCSEAELVGRRELLVIDGVSAILNCETPALKSGESYERSPAVCFECCAKDDRKHMVETGKIALYLIADKEVNRFHVGNWPGSLDFAVLGNVQKSFHNIARHRYDVWFNGPDGFVWHGVQYGDNTQICHCRRTKERVVALSNWKLKSRKGNDHDDRLSL